MWVQLVIAIVVAIIGQLLAPKPPKPEDAANQEPQGIPTIADTAVIPVLFGTREIREANVAWYGDLRMDPIHPPPSGGK